LTFQWPEGRRCGLIGHVAEQGENEMNISLDTMPAPVRDYLTAMNALDSVGMVAPFASDGR
jgi:hypothetical protein